MRHLSDPRISMRGGWMGISEQIRHVMFRWLVGLELRDFFRLLDETALDRHWRYRKAFWSAYLDQDYISDAWVTLGPEAAKIAHRKLEGGNKGAGMLWGNGVKANHSVLIMRIDSITIAEWSHNGTCRFWLDGNKHAPKLYQEDYSRRGLMNGADFEQRHSSADRGAWQDSVAHWIKDNTGIKMPMYQYMPRGHL